MEVEIKGKVLPIASEQAFQHGHGHVAEKYRGTAADKRDMEIMGKEQVLRVSVFHRLKMLD